jgi:hypothetical protein
MDDYQLIDEPRSSSLAHLTTNPMWPLLGYMLGSAFFSWIWYGLNSHAMGSPTKKKEFGLILFGAIGYFVWFMVVNGLKQDGVIDERWLPFLRLGLTLFALTVTYILFVMQRRPFEIHEHYAGKVMNGMPGLFLAIFLGNKLQQMIITSVITVLHGL